MSTQPVDRERRLAQIRDEAEQNGVASGTGITPAGSPLPRASGQTGYYGIPLLKPPQWSWEIPLYFFVGGAAGSASVIGAAADWVGDDYKLARDARWLAAGGVGISTALLIADLGRPSRFLNMLRVLKWQSPMNVGAWVLATFGAFSTAAAFAKEVEQRWSGLPVRVISNLSQAGAAALGLPLHNYTGVLIGATVIPVWNRNISTLPIHFGMSGVQAACSLLELAGHTDSRALNVLALISTLWETYQGVEIESRREEGLRPLKRGVSGWLVRTGGVLSGPLPLALRLISAASGSRSRRIRKWAAISGIAGSLLTRIGWIRAGVASARDWRLPLELPPARMDGSETDRMLEPFGREGVA